MKYYRDCDDRELPNNKRRAHGAAHIKVFHSILTCKMFNDNVEYAGNLINDYLEGGITID